MVAQAHATLYGSLRVQIADADGKDLDIQDNTSRIGIKATSELFSGATAIAHFESYANTESGAFGTPTKGRLAYVGATGDFGTVTAGRQWTPQYLWTSGKVDLLDHGSNPTHSYTYAGRQGNTVAYITPDMGGLQAAAVLVARAGGEVEANTGDDADAYNLAVHYAADNFSVGAATLIYNGTVDETYTAVAASLNLGAATIAAEMTSNGIDDKDTFEVAGSMGLSDDLKVLANFVSFEDGTQVAAEAQYKLGAKSRVAVSAVVADDDAIDAGESADSVAVSWRVDF
jgi:predicted porin